MGPLAWPTGRGRAVAQHAIPHARGSLNRKDAPMPTSPTLYAVSPGSAPGELAIEQLWQQGDPSPLVAAGYSHLVPVDFEGQDHLLGIDASGACSVFRV